MRREAELQDKLIDLVGEVTRSARFSGLDITRIERDWPVNNKKVDIAIFTRGETPFMFIETKREGKARDPLLDPLDVSVVGQVMTYAAIYKRQHPEHEIPFVATANPSLIAVFRVPKNIVEYIDWKAVLTRDYKGAIRRKYRSIIEEQMVGKCLKLSLTKEFVNYLLEQLAKEHVEKRVIKPQPTEALIDRFRGFVNTLSERCAPLIDPKLKEGGLFRSEVEKLGYKLDSEEAMHAAVENLSRMMAYVLMNKLIFRKILEPSYRLPPMVLLDTSSLSKFKEQLNYNFEKAIAETKDFEPIFHTGVHDQIPIPDDPELMEYINEFIYTLESFDIVKIGDQIGYMYEVLIPPEERHQLGQFYTPPWVCELITRWCIRDPDDVVLDPGVGSGGFLLRAYNVLQEKKIGPSITSMVRSDIHERILSQLYALDINPFPAHLSAVGISIKNIRVPSTKLNVLVSDFFALQPGQEVLSPYKVKTIVGEEERKIVLPKFDAVVGNPPYTRWTEIPDDTQKLIKKHLGKLTKGYGLTPQVSRGVEPGIYTYWIMHAHDFLKEGGRLGMIISNTWLQTDYGIGFGNFLLDNFRIKAVVDTALKLFKDALVTTCIVLAEKESVESKRLENEVAFIHIPGQVESADVDGLLKAVETSTSKEYTVTLVKQGELSRDRKWIDLFFKTTDISNRPFMTKLGELFEPSYGNVTYLYLTSTSEISGVRNPGSSEFHYLSPSKIKEHALDKWAYPKAPLKDALVYPAITSARQTNFFTFSEQDWEGMRKSDDKCYMFVGHSLKEKLPKEVADYIKWGETECRTRLRGSRKGGRLASETEAAKARAKEKKRFYGWYDLGEVIPATIFAVRQAWHKSRFAWCKFPVTMYDALIALAPKKGVFLNETQTKALLAYLNSSFSQSYIETDGRKSPGGIIGFEVNIAREMPILDVRQLNEKQLGSLAKLFDELEHEARKIGGASTKEQIEKLKPKIYDIDRAVAALLGIMDEDVKNVETQVDLMVERRVSAVKKAR